MAVSILRLTAANIDRPAAVAAFARLDAFAARIPVSFRCDVVGHEVIGSATYRHYALDPNGEGKLAAFALDEAPDVIGGLIGQNVGDASLLAPELAQPGQTAIMLRGYDLRPDVNRGPEIFAATASAAKAAGFSFIYGAPQGGLRDGIIRVPGIVVRNNGETWLPLALAV